MLQQARAKARQQGIDNVTFKQMDLEHLDFPEQNFEAATCGFGLFFLEDMSRGLQNIAATVKPGGKIAVSNFVENAFEPMSSHFLDLYEAFTKKAAPLSRKRLASDDALKKLFHTVNIRNVKIYHEPLGYYLTSAQDWWDVVWNAGYRVLFNQLSEAEQAAFKQQHLNDIEQLCATEKTWLDTSAIIAVGVKE